MNDVGNMMSGTGDALLADVLDAGNTQMGPDVGQPDARDFPSQLNGSRPSQALPPPEFVALNSDGEMRTPADLLGQPTVMWFFPFAGTPG